MDMPVLDKVFGMEGGYVLDFSNRTFADFFREELQVNIDDPRWALQGGSKAKRLRYYLRQADRKTVLDTLNALWEYREASAVTHDYPELDDTVRAAFFGIIGRLGGAPPGQQASATASAGSRIDAAAASALARRLLQVARLESQPRGYAFEKLLKDMFNAYGLSARASFRLVGEQIDGSFVSGGDTYLLEAKSLLSHTFQLHSSICGFGAPGGEGGMNNSTSERRSNRLSWRTRSIRCRVQLSRRTNFR